MGEEHPTVVCDDDDHYEMEESGEKKLLSRYGIWLLVELCRPRDDVPIVCTQCSALYSYDRKPESVGFVRSL